MTMNKSLDKCRLELLYNWQWSHGGRMDWKWSLMFLILMSSCYHTTQAQVDHKLVKKYFIDIYNRALIKAMKEQDTLTDRSSSFAPLFKENMKSSNFSPYAENYDVFHDKREKLTKKGVKKKPSTGSLFQSPEEILASTKLAGSGLLRSSRFTKLWIWKQTWLWHRYPGKPTVDANLLLQDVTDEYEVFIGVIVQSTHRFDFNACDALYHSVMKRCVRQYPFPLCQEHILRDYALAVKEVSTDRLIQRSFWRAHRRNEKGDIDHSLQ